MCTGGMKKEGEKGGNVVDQRRVASVHQRKLKAR